MSLSNTFFGESNPCRRIRPIHQLNIKTQMKLKSALPSRIESSTCDVTVASYNVENLHPKKSTFTGLAKHIVQFLHSPDIIGLQEVQDNNGPTNDQVVASDETLKKLIDGIKTAGGPVYNYLVIDPSGPNQDGGQPGGNIRPAFLYRPDRLSLPTGSKPGKPMDAQEIIMTKNRVALKYNPGRLDPKNAVWTRSRKPLVAVFEHEDGQRVIVINVHLKAKSGSTSLYGSVQPPKNGGVDSRAEQVQVIKSFVDSIRTSDPSANVIVLGDFNEFQMAPPMQDLIKSGDLVELLDIHLTPEERYTYNFDGNSQALDHIIVSSNLAANSDIEAVHVNTWTQTSSSDHDPLLARVNLCKQRSTKRRKFFSFFH